VVTPFCSTGRRGAHRTRLAAEAIPVVAPTHSGALLDRNLHDSDGVRSRHEEVEPKSRGVKGIRGSLT
jgi:hypothetical protein